MLTFIAHKKKPQKAVRVYIALSINFFYKFIYTDIGLIMLICKFDCTILVGRLHYCQINEIRIINI